MLNTLEQYPRLTASRLYAMVRERGYSGGEDHFRHLIAHHRPRPQPEAYLRLKTLPAARGDNLGSVTAALLRLLDRYGAAALEAGIAEALARDVPHPNAVRLALERLREQRDQPPPLPIALPADKRIRDLVVSSHKLDNYDQLQVHQENTDDAHNDG